MDNLFHSVFDDGLDYLSILKFNLIHVSKRSHRCDNFELHAHLSLWQRFNGFRRAGSRTMYVISDDKMFLDPCMIVYIYKLPCIMICR